jgi:single-stranded-DNA-specific exonuclease
MAGSAETARAYSVAPYDYVEVRRLAAELGLAEPIAVTLVRRGYRTVESAREFLAAEEVHDPLEFDGMEAACELVLSMGRGSRITVHGDYDVDGVCATAILVSTLRELGKDCDWLIPDRKADGYGLTMATVEQLRKRGSELVITVDCGISSAAEVAEARAAGMQVLVTDHHEPPADLPDCQILHPVVSNYPFKALCATAVAHKLACALRNAAGRRHIETVGGRRDEADRDLDLVALATVADMVPLVGENRRLVREGLSVLRRGTRLGLRALIGAARLDQTTLDEGGLGFGLAPRINAAGRLYRADAGVELMLTEEPDRAAQIAAELDRANAERRATEREVVAAAERARAELPDEQRAAPALVLAGEGWHPGVVGIAASRLADRHWRPTVLIALEGGRGRGSARSIPGFDLVAALEACSDHLGRFGGHRAAAGLELDAAHLDDFRAAFLEHAAEAIDPSDLVRTESLDALVGVGHGGIGMELAEQLETLGPFGMGNPGPRLLVPSGRLRGVRPLGEEERHSRFDLESGAGRAAGVAFGMNGEISRREDEVVDLSVRLEVDRWNGAVQPRVVVRELYPLDSPASDDAAGGGEEAAGCGAGACPAPALEWWARVAEELVREGAPQAKPRSNPFYAGEGRREVIDRRGGATVAALAELISSGESVLALCADASRRRALADSAADPRRFGAGEPMLVCGRCGEEAIDLALGAEGSETEAPLGLVLADWAALARRPAAPRRFQHVVLVDPPPFESLERLATDTSINSAASTLSAATNTAAGSTAGYAHLAWGRSELELAERCLGFEWQLRGAIGHLWRGLERAGGEASGDALRELLTGPGRHPRSAEVAGRCIAVLRELGLCEWTLDRVAPRLRVLSSERTELERSRAFGACAARHQEGIRYLRSRAQST